MTVVVAYKWAASPQDAAVTPDGTVDWSRARAAISEYDPIALQIARELADASGDDVVGISVGGAALVSSLAKKAALSRGLDRGVVVADDATADWNLVQTGEALAKLVQRVEGASILIAGDSSIDEAAKMVPVIAAGYLAWPAFQQVASVEKSETGWTITQNVRGGTRSIAVTGPVVVQMASDALVPKVPGMKDILAAGKKEILEVAVDELGMTAASVEVSERAVPEAVDRRREILTGPDAASRLASVLTSSGLA